MDKELKQIKASLKGWEKTALNCPERDLDYFQGAIKGLKIAIEIIENNKV